MTQPDKLPVNKSESEVEVILCVRSDLIPFMAEVLKGTKVKLGMNESLGGLNINE